MTGREERKKVTIIRTKNRKGESQVRQARTIGANRPWVPDTAGSSAVREKVSVVEQEALRGAGGIRLACAYKM